MDVYVNLNDHPSTREIQPVCPKCGSTDLKQTFMAWASGAAGFECNTCDDGEEFVVRFESPV